MPRLSDGEVLRRKLAAERRSLSEREILPVLRGKVHFPAWLLETVHDYGLSNLTLGDVWPKSLIGKGPRRGPRGSKSGGGGSKKEGSRVPESHVGHGTLDPDLLWELKKHREPVSTSVLAQALGVTGGTIRRRLTRLKAWSLVERTGINKDTRYALTVEGRKKVRGRPPRRKH